MPENNQCNSTIWEEFLATAIYTPSPHNTQPWRLRVTDDRRAVLFMERARMLPDEDTTGHFLRLAMAMFLESLRIVAANAGYTLRHTLVDAVDPTSAFIKFAELELQPGAQPSDYPNALLHKRMTSRLESNGLRIAPEITGLLKELEPEQGQRYYQIDDAGLIEIILQENIRAVFHDMNESAYHDEIARWFRYSDAEAQSKADGLDYRCMGLRATELKLMKYLPQIMRWPVTRDYMRWMYRGQLGMVTHLGAISGQFFDNDGVMQAGVYLLRFWLELARHNLHIHPFGNLVTNAQARARVRELTGIDSIWLVFRIGYTDEPPRPYRRTASEVLLND